MTDIRPIQPIVLLRQKWSEGWIRVPYLYCDQCLASLQPAMPQATLSWHYGNIGRPGAAQAQVERLIDGYLDWYVRVKDPVTKEVRFQGRIAGSEEQPFGPDKGVEAGDQAMTCLGLESLLGRSPVDGSYIRSPGGTLYKAGAVLPFNLTRHGQEALAGNRSKEKVGGSYVFSEDGKLWSSADIVQYLVQRFGPASIFPLVVGQVGNLDLIKRAYRPAGTVLACLNQLIDRRRGSCWHVTMNDAPAVRVHSVFDEQARAGANTLAPNPSRIDCMDLDALGTDVAEGTTIRSAAEHRYDKIVVRGGPLVVCGSVSVRLGTIVPAWGKDLEKDFWAADEAAKGQERFADVFRAFKSPEKGKIFDSGDVPTVRDNGAIDSDNRQGLMRTGRSFLRQLPLMAGWDYWRKKEAVQTDPEAPRNLIKPMAWVLYTEQPGGKKRYYSLPEAGYTLTMLDGELSFRFTVGAAQNLAHNHFPPKITGWRGTWLRLPTMSVGDDGSPFDYESICATVAVTADSLLAVEVAVQADPNLKGVIAQPEGTRTLVLDMPDCEAWVLLEGTLVDLDDDGTLHARRGGDLVIRNDRDKLLAVAELARTWYGRVRRAVEFTLHTQPSFNSLGHILRTLKVSGRTWNLHTIVSSITYRFRTRPGMTVKTDFAELDFIDIAGGAQGGASLAAAALTAPDVRSRIADVPARLAEVSLPAMWRTGVVVDGRAMTPRQAAFYPAPIGPGAAPERSLYFDEVNPTNMKPFPGSWTRDKDNQWLPVRAVAKPRADGPNSDWLPLAAGAAFRFMLDDGKAWIVSDHRPRGLFRVKVTKDGGLAGDATTGCTWTYTVKTDDELTTLGTALSPEKARPSIGPMQNPAGVSPGWGYYTHNTFHLWDANETLQSCT